MTSLKEMDVGEGVCPVKETAAVMATEAEGNGSSTKRRRLENDDATATLDDVAVFNKTFDFQQGEEISLNLNDVSPDECDAEEPALFPSPSRALGELDRAVALDYPSDSRFTAGLFCGDKQSATKDDGRPQESSGAVTKLRSLQQLEDLLGSVPFLTSDCGKLPPSSSSFLLGGETVLFVIHHGGEGGVLPQRATEELSKCRIFCLDLSDLPACEYSDGDGDNATRSHDDNCRGDSTGLLRLPATNTLLSLATQTTRRSIGHVLRRVSSILCVAKISDPGDTDGDTTTREAAPAHSAGGRGPLTLPLLVVWRAEGGPLDEYPQKTTDTKQDGDEQVSPFIINGTSHGRSLLVKSVTSVDQLHCFSLLTPVYTLPHLLRTLFRAALSPTHVGREKVAGSRSLIYFGASWCPPCMRIVNALPAMLQSDFPESLTCLVKADMDLATPLFEFFGVEIIPTFIIFDNEVLRDAGDWDALFSSPFSESSLRQLCEGLRRGELGRIQDSQRLTVRRFVESHSGALRFDDDF